MHARTVAVHIDVSLEFPNKAKTIGWRATVGDHHGDSLLVFGRESDRRWFDKLKKRGGERERGRGRERGGREGGEGIRTHHYSQSTIQPGAVKMVLWRHWMHLNFMHPVTSENQFHCTRLYSTKFCPFLLL